MILRNREGHAAFDCQPDHQNRRPGLAALLRVHNEATWLWCCLTSIIAWCDEIVLALNCCTDDTPEIAKQWWRAYPEKVKVFTYPFTIYPMGPGHDRCPADSVHACAYYYNLTQARSTRTHVLKWDGDMIAMDWLGPELRALMDSGKDRIKFEGVDLVDDARHTGCHPRCPTNGVYRVQPGVHYAQGPMTQNLRGVPEPEHMIARPAFTHMKWAKPFEAATVQWPENWREIPHFQRIAERRRPVARYEGEYPTPVRAVL